MRGHSGAAGAGSGAVPLRGPTIATTSAFVGIGRLTVALPLHAEDLTGHAALAGAALGGYLVPMLGTAPMLALVAAIQLLAAGLGTIAGGRRLRRVTERARSGAIEYERKGCESPTSNTRKGFAVGAVARMVEPTDHT